MPRVQYFSSRWIITAAIVLFAGACGSDGTDPAGSGPPAADDTTAPPSVAATAAPEPPPDAEDRSEELLGRWEIVNYQLPDGAGLTNVVGDQPAFIEFGPDGSVEYHTGCNQGTSEYSTSGGYVVPKSALDDAVEGQPLTLGPSFAQTEIGCEGFLGDQDVDLPANMSAVTRFLLREDRLLLSGEFLLIEATRPN